MLVSATVFKGSPFGHRSALGRFLVQNGLPRSNSTCLVCRVKMCEVILHLDGCRARELGPCRRCASHTVRYKIALSRSRRALCDMSQLLESRSSGSLQFMPGPCLWSAYPLPR